MSFLKTFLGGGSSAVIGVDIGTTSIKIAELAKADKQLKLTNYALLETYGYLERANEALQTSSLKLSEDTIPAYLKLLVEHAGIQTTSAVVSVPAFLAFSTLIEMPVMSEGEVKRYMELQAKQYVPLPLNTVTLDWMKVGERPEPGGAPKQQVLLVSIPNDQIERYRKIFDRAGLHLTGVELEGTGVARSLTFGSKTTTLIIDIGSRSTSFSVAGSGFLKFSGQTDFSGGSLTQTIANGLGISARRAEDLKRQRGLLGFGGEHELSTLIEPILDVIVNEAKRVSASYEQSYHEAVGRVALSGGGANLLGIEDYFKKQFTVPVLRANPFAPVNYPAVIEPVVKDTGPLLSVAIGLAIKGFIN